MAFFIRKTVFHHVIWIILCGTLAVEQESVISDGSFTTLTDLSKDQADDDDVHVPTVIKETPVMILDVDAACDDDSDSLREFLVAISDVGPKIKSQGINTEILTLENIDDLMCSMASYTTDVLERNILETLRLDLMNIHIHVIGNRLSDEESVNDSIRLENILKKYKVTVDVWGVRGCSLKGNRIKRQASSPNVYQNLAAQSGGLFINTTKGQIGQAANILKQSVKPNTVYLEQFPFSKPMMSDFKIPVDATMTQLTILITTQSGPPVSIPKTPAGLPVSFAKGSGNSIQSLGATSSLMEFNITQPALHYGNWIFQKLDGQNWTVQATGQSELDFTYQFLQTGPGGYGQYAIKGRPISGEQHKLKITVPQYAKVKSVTTALFVNEQNLPTNLTLKNLGGRRGKSIFFAQLNMPTDSFKIAIEGMDKTNHVFRRLNPLLVQPISVKLIVPSTSGVKLYKNETLVIPFTVGNAASKDQDIDVKIEDDKHFALDPRVRSFTIKPGGNSTGNFKIKAGMTVGETTTVTITAKPYVRGQNIPGQFEIRRFTVEERPKNKTQDKINPTCNVTKIVGTCNIGSDLCACVNHSWSMEVLVGDEGFGVREIFPNGAGSNQSFMHDNFTIGHTISQGVLHASIGADCCHQRATIEVVDDAGNVASCTPNITQNFKPPDPSHCNSTQLNVTIPCNSTKISGTCGNFSANPCDCHNKGWHMEVAFGSVGWNLYNVFTVNAGNNASLQRNGNVVELNADCCYQQITIMAEDIAGNIGQCNVSIGTFQTPKPGDCTTTTTSTTTTTTPTSTTTTSTTPTTTITKAKATAASKSTASSSVSQSKSSGTATTAGTGSQITASAKTSEEKTSNGDHLTSGIVAGAMTGAGVVAIAALVVVGVVVWKALSKAKTVEPMRNERRRENSWT